MDPKKLCWPSEGSLVITAGLSSLLVVQEGPERARLEKARSEEVVILSIPLKEDNAEG